MAQPRPLATIEAAARHVLADRGVKLAARNRREQDMLRALADVEQFDREIAACDTALEKLFEERDHARIAERLVRP